MPTFHFGIRDGHRIDPDVDGFPARGIETAYEMVLLEARHMMGIGPATGEDLSGRALRVFDERGGRVFAVPFSLAAVDRPCARAPARRRRTT